MSTLTLDSLKDYLRIIHDADDAMLQDLLDGAESEVLAFLNAESFEIVKNNFSVIYQSSSSSELELPPDIYSCIKILVRSDYEESDPSKAKAWREHVERRLFPYRLELGV